MAFSAPRYTFADDWLILGSLTAISCVVGYLNGFSGPNAEAISIALPVVIFAPFVFWQLPQKLFPNLCSLIAVLCLIVATILINAHALYVLTSLNLPLWDAQLLKVDEFFGFDHIAFRNVVSQNAFLADILSFAYCNTAYVLYGALILLLLQLDFQRIVETLSLLVMCVAATMFFSTVLPAVGTYPYLNLGKLEPGFLNKFDTGEYYQTYLDLRSGVLTSFPLEQWRGIVTFPSFHFIYALLAVFAVADQRWLAIPVSIFASVVAISAIPVGGHYVADIIGAIVIWAASVWYVNHRRPLSMTTAARGPDAIGTEDLPPVCA